MQPLPVGTRAEVEVTRIEPRFAVVQTEDGHVGILHRSALTRVFFVSDVSEVLQVGERFPAVAEGVTMSGLTAFSIVRLDGAGLKMRRQTAERIVSGLCEQLHQLGWAPVSPEDRFRLVRLVMLRGETVFRVAVDDLLSGGLVSAILDRVEERLALETAQRRAEEEGAADWTESAAPLAEADAEDGSSRPLPQAPEAEAEGDPQPDDGASALPLPAGADSTAP